MYILNEYYTDFQTGQAFLNYLMGGVEMSIDKFRDIWSGTLQAFDNKDSDFTTEKEKKLDDKKLAKKRKELNEEFDGIIEFLKKLLSNDNIQNDQKSLQMLLNSRTTEKHRTILHILVLKRVGKNFLDELCINGSINPNITDKYHETPLHIVTKTQEDTQSISMTQSLLNNPKTEINVTNISSDNETALHYSIKYESPALCNIFLNHNKLNINQLTSKGDNYLHYSTKNPNENIALMVINEHQHPIPNINAKDRENGNTALHLSMSKPQLFEKLVLGFNDEININIHNNEGEVPLMKACEFIQHTTNLDLLLTQPTLEINAVDNKGNAALHRITCYNNTLEHFSKLLNHQQIDVNSLNCSRGYAPLHIAYGVDNDNAMYQKMQLLLNHRDINVNLQTTHSGDTALHFGVKVSLWRGGRRNKLVLLLSHSNINYNISNRSNATPSLICISQINEWTQKLKEAQQELERERRELERYQRIYEEKRRDYDNEYTKYSGVEQEYNRVKAEYDRKYNQWQAETDAYDRARADPELQRTVKRPGNKPSDYNVRNMKSKLDDAKRRLDEKERKMKDAERYRDNQQREVDRAIRRVNDCERTLNSSHQINNLLKQYINSNR